MRPATKDDRRRWLSILYQNKQKISHMLVVCDRYNYSDYPAYIWKTENVDDAIADYNSSSLQSVMEVYSSDLDIEFRVNEINAWHTDKNEKENKTIQEVMWVDYQNKHDEVEVDISTPLAHLSSYLGVVIDPSGAERKRCVLVHEVGDDYQLCCLETDIEERWMDNVFGVSFSSIAELIQVMQDHNDDWEFIASYYWFEDSEELWKWFIEKEDK